MLSFCIFCLGILPLALSLDKNVNQKITPNPLIFKRLGAQRF
jgi:hypothetical protein